MRAISALPAHGVRRQPARRPQDTVGLASEQILRFLAQLLDRNLRVDTLRLSGAEQGGFAKSKIQLVGLHGGSQQQQRGRASPSSGVEGTWCCQRPRRTLRGIGTARGQTPVQTAIWMEPGPRTSTTRGCSSPAVRRRGKKLEVVCVLNGR